MIAIGAAQTEVLCYTLTVCVTVSCRVCPVVIDIVIGVLDIIQLRYLLCLVVDVILHLCAAFLATLCCHEDNTVGTTRTIDGCRSGILEHIDALDVVGRDIVNGRHLHTVDNEERVVRLCDRAATTHTDGH